MVGPSINDIHQDHKTVAEEMRRCFWRSCNIISYDLPWNSNEFRPTMYVRLNFEDVRKRDDAILSYASQGDKLDLYADIAFQPVVIREAWAPWAEAFEVIRWIF